jgi:hypothetical protein
MFHVPTRGLLFVGPVGLDELELHPNIEKPMRLTLAAIRTFLNIENLLLNCVNPHFVHILNFIAIKVFYINTPPNLHFDG